MDSANRSFVFFFGPLFLTTTSFLIFFFIFILWFTPVETIHDEEHERPFVGDRFPVHRRGILFRFSREAEENPSSRSFISRNRRPRAPRDHRSSISSDFFLGIYFYYFDDFTFPLLFFTFPTSAIPVLEGLLPIRRIDFERISDLNFRRIIIMEKISFSFLPTFSISVLLH